MGHGAPLDGGGDDIGEAGPYFLDVGLSSTRRIAAFWGLPVPAFAGRKSAKPRVNATLADMLLAALGKAGMRKR